jgi:hypothetical protein
LTLLLVIPFCDRRSIMLRQAPKAAAATGDLFMLSAAYLSVMLKAVIMGALFGAAFAFLWPWAMRRLGAWQKQSISAALMRTPRFRVGLALASGSSFGFLQLLMDTSELAGLPLLVVALAFGMFALAILGTVMLAKSAAGSGPPPV